MGLRPGHCYRSKKDRAYSRLAVRVHKKNYIGAAPGLKTRQFNMGNPNKDFKYIVNLIVEEAVQIRDNAIESARIAINRYLYNKLGKENYFMKIRVYPHHILRENKQAQGAHADRIQQGMSQAFGKPIGRAARVRPGQVIVSVLVDKGDANKAKRALLRAKARMTCKLHVDIGTDVKSIGTKPKKVREITTEEIEAEEAAAKEKEAAEKAKEVGKKVEEKPREERPEEGKEKEAEGEEKGKEKAGKEQGEKKPEEKKPEGKEGNK